MDRTELIKETAETSHEAEHLYFEFVEDLDSCSTPEEARDMLGFFLDKLGELYEGKQVCGKGMARYERAAFEAISRLDLQY